MATYTKYENFIQTVCNKEIDMFGTDETFRIVIHTDAPVVATDTTVANVTQITGTGYSAADIQNDATRSGGTVTLTAVDFTWTATAADWTSTARYFSIYDDTPTTPTADPLMCTFDYGATFAVLNGETVTADFGVSLCTVS